jgi:hypothetical protein
VTHTGRGAAGGRASIRIRKYFAARNSILFAGKHGSAAQRAKLGATLAVSLPLQLLWHWPRGTMGDVRLKIRGGARRARRTAAAVRDAGAQVSRAALAAGLAVAVYVACLRRYGIFDPADEGLLLVQAWRAAHGEMPYVDFHTGYGPLYFRLQSLLVAAGGLAAVRWVLVAVHGAGAALLYVLARRVCGPALAAVAVALQVAFFLPVAPARGAPFNAPYPAWYAGVAGVAVAVLLARPRGVRGRGGGRRLRARLRDEAEQRGPARRGRRDGDRARRDADARLARDARRSSRSAPSRSSRPTGPTLTAIALVPPVLALVVLGGEGEAPGDARLALLAATFAATATVSYAPTLAALGFSHFSRDVLLVGSNVEGLYALAFPWTAVVAAIVGLAAFLDRGRHARTAAIAALGVIAVTVAGAATDADVGAGAIRRGAEVAALVAVPLVGWGTATALRRVRDAALVAPTALAVVGALQLYPRPDFLHLMRSVRCSCRCAPPLA